MNYKIIARLVSNWEFVIGVRDYYEVVSVSGANSYMAQKYLERIFTRALYILDIGSIKHIRKEVAYARDLIKSYGFKRIASPRNKIRNMLNHKLASYPRATKDDVYVRDYDAERWEQERRWSCCMPYDCMCYENIPLGQIWKKVNQERKVG